MTPDILQGNLITSVCNSGKIFFYYLAKHSNFFICISAKLNTKVSRESSKLTSLVFQKLKSIEKKFLLKSNIWMSPGHYFGTCTFTMYIQYLKHKIRPPNGTKQNNWKKSPISANLCYFGWLPTFTPSLSVHRRTRQAINNLKPGGALPCRTDAF